MTSASAPGPRFGKNIRIELIEGTQPSFLLALVAKILPDAKPLDGALHGLGPGRYHAGQARGHLRSQRHLPSTPVGKGKELTDNFITRLLLEQIQRFQDRTIALLEVEGKRGTAPNPKEVIAHGTILRVKIPESRQGFKHREKCAEIRREPPLRDQSSSRFNSFKLTLRSFPTLNLTTARLGMSTSISGLFGLRPTRALRI